ncbi:MAG: hypothetical protein RLZZ214_683 [Verrucomicrobiota bacterium]|jgi:hypothetical protein
MKWLENPYRHTANEAEDFSYPPSGGRVKLVVLGILLPLVVAYFGVDAWITEEAVWFGRGNADMEVHGRTAKSLGVAYTSVGLFCHFRWFWGLLPVYRVFEVGTVISLLGFLGGLAFGVYYLFI